MSLRPSVIAAALLWSVSAWAFAHAGIGDLIEDVELSTVSGGKEHLLGNAAANVFIFFKPGQEHSNSTLKQIAVCEKEFAGKSVHWAAIVSERFPKEIVEAEVKEAGLAMPVLIDTGDALYGRLGLALTPVVGLADREHKLAAYLPFAKVNYSEIIRAHLRRLLGEITEEEMNQILKPPEMIQGSDPELARRRFKLAEKLFQLGSFDKAMESAKRSLEKDPSSAAAHALLGQILAAQGKKAEASKAFEAALKLEPTNEAALKGAKETLAK